MLASQRSAISPTGPASRALPPWDFQPVRDATRLYIRNDQELKIWKPWRGSRSTAEGRRVRDLLKRALFIASAVIAVAGVPCVGRPCRRCSRNVPRSRACRDVRLADVGWSDVTATTAILAQVLRELGYEPHTTLLAVPVTFASMKAANIDVFLGNWMPAQTNDRWPYLADGSVEIVRPTSSGAKYTLAVPAYTYEAGLRDFADIQRFSEQLHGKIYGIEAGNDGNHHVLDMIAHNELGLGSFTLVESSEQGMLARSRAHTTPSSPSCSWPGIRIP